SKKIKLIRDIAKAIGHKGMAGGQVFDLLYKNKPMNNHLKKKTDYMKTGKLFEICFKVPFYFKKIKRIEREKIIKIAKNFGIAFQIRDDIEDNEGDIKRLKIKLENIYENLKKELIFFGKRGETLNYLIEKTYGNFF
ncbi:MAG: polyprenyl synthetase family protein, partial [bacterium]|nr:polyprenyl synthetase family protein [bacterium]MDW8164468.1 polyprenyl synthetase family protein [Candidatus Omnitrophota bacterium]